MLFKIALVLLAVWLLGVVGLYTIGDLVQVFLLAGLGLLLLAFLRARDAPFGVRSVDLLTNHDRDAIQGRQLHL